MVDWTKIKAKILKFFMWLLRTYKKEAKAFVDGIIDEAYRHLEREVIDKLEAGIRKKVKSEVIKQIFIQGIDIYTPKGKVAIENMVNNYIDKLSMEG